MDLDGKTRQHVGRARAEELWTLIANGILEPASWSPNYRPAPPGDGPGDPAPEYHFMVCLDFVRSVAQRVLEADKAKSDERARKMLSAVGLSGKRNKVREAAVRAARTPEFSFPPDDRAWERGERAKQLYEAIRRADPSLRDLSDDDLRKQLAKSKG